MMENKKVAWIGTGVMGSQQAGHLAKNGYDVSAYTHKYEKLLELEKEFGIHPCHSTAEAVKDADYIFVMVGYPSDVEEVFCGEGGIFQSAKPGALAIDMTTSSPSLAQRLYEEGKAKGIRVMDAPVSGGDSGARNATLSIMVGGDEKDFEEALPLFQCMGKNIILMGPAPRRWSTPKTPAWTRRRCWRPSVRAPRAAGSCRIWRRARWPGTLRRASLSSTSSRT